MNEKCGLVRNKELVTNTWQIIYITIIWYTDLTWLQCFKDGYSGEKIV